MLNSKAPEKDSVQRYWSKILTSLYPPIVVQLNHIIDEERPFPDLMTFAKTVLCQKDPAKGSQLITLGQHPACP